MENRQLIFPVFTGFSKESGKYLWKTTGFSGFWLQWQRRCLYSGMVANKSMEEKMEQKTNCPDFFEILWESYQVEKMKQMEAERIKSDEFWNRTNKELEQEQKRFDRFAIPIATVLGIAISYGMFLLSKI